MCGKCVGRVICLPIVDDTFSFATKYNLKQIFYNEQIKNAFVQHKLNSESTLMLFS